LAGVVVCFTVIYFWRTPEKHDKWHDDWEYYQATQFQYTPLSPAELEAIQKAYDRPALCQRSEAHPGGCAYATLVNGNDYIELALVLGESLRETNSPYPLIALTTHKTSQRGVELMERAGLIVHTVDDVQLPKSLQPWRENWRHTYVKLLLWNLTSYERIVTIDADSLVLSNMDELFSLHGEYITATDRHLCQHEFEPGMSGMTAVLWPGAKVAHELFQFFHSSGSAFSRGDQSVTEFFFDMRKSITSVNETWSSFVYRCQCEDYPFQENKGPKSVHFTTWFRPHVTASGVSIPLGLSAKARTCARSAYVHWEEMWKKAMTRVDMTMDEFVKENIRHTRG